MSDQLARYPEYNQIIQAVLKADALLSGQKEVLELLAKRAPLFQVLHRLVSIVEEQYDGTFCSILLVDNVNKTFKAGVRVEYEKKLQRGRNRRFNFATLYGPLLHGVTLARACVGGRYCQRFTLASALA